MITYGEEFTNKPISLYDFLILGKISDQLSHPNFFKEYDPQVIELQGSKVVRLPKTYNNRRLGHNWSLSWVADQLTK